MKLRIAGAQIQVTKDIQSNVITISRAIDFAAGEKADILLTPEGSLSGYTHLFDQKKVSEALAAITERAKKSNLGLALGTCFMEEDNQCYNQIRFYDADGTFLGFHNKTLTCGTPTNPPVGEVNHYSVKPLRVFNLKGITIGGLICNDMWANPCYTPMPDTHLLQQLSFMGAKIVFHSVNGGSDTSEFSRVAVRNYHESNLRLRAKAGKVWIATVDNCRNPHIPCSSLGGVIGPDGNRVLEMPDKGEQFFTYTIEF